MEKEKIIDYKIQVTKILNGILRKKYPFIDDITKLTAYSNDSNSIFIATFILNPKWVKDNVNTDDYEYVMDDVKRKGFSQFSDVSLSHETDGKFNDKEFREVLETCLSLVGMVGLSFTFRDFKFIVTNEN